MAIHTNSKLLLECVWMCHCIMCLPTVCMAAALIPSFSFFPWHALCSIMFEHQRQYNMACCAAVELVWAECLLNEVICHSRGFPHIGVGLCSQKTVHVWVVLFWIAAALQNVTRKIKINRVVAWWVIMSRDWE